MKDNTIGVSLGVILSIVCAWLLIKMCGHLGSIAKTVME